MPMQRLFVIAPSLARLILKEKAGERVQEGYFPDQPQHRTFIQVEEARSSLILEAGGDAATEEQTDLPPAHAQALLAVSQGQVGSVRTRLAIGSHELQALHVVRPGPLDLGAIAVPSEDEHNFHPLPWVGPEVSTEPAYQRLALDSAPTVPEIEFTDAALNRLLDLCWKTSSQAGPRQGTPRGRSHRHPIAFNPRHFCTRASGRSGGGR